MPDDPKTADSLTPAVKNRSMTEGDIPDLLKRRYYTDGRGGAGLAFYVDARVAAPAFRDRGRELVATQLDPNSIRDMIAIAQHRDWSIVAVRGSVDFRREAWLAGRSIGLEVRGHRPTERDLQELQRRQDRAHRTDDRREIRTERREEVRDRAADDREVRRERRDEAGGHAQLRVVDAVVQSRIRDPERQAQIMALARDRIADWLERGARFSDLRADRASSNDRQRIR